MHIGIVGAENSHAAAIAGLINIEQKFKGASVDYLWGETVQFAQKTANAGQIPNIVKKPKDMLRKVDAVIVDHRHPKFHLEAALPFIRKGIPVFVDKPFCFRAEDGKEFLHTAKKHKAAVTSFSTLPHQRSFMRFKKKISESGRVTAGATYGACDLGSKYGGVFFYGIHQVDAALHAFGYNVSRVLLTRNGNGATGQLIYTDGKIVTMNLIREGAPGFQISAACTDALVHQKLTFDKSTYLTGVKCFMKMFHTGEEPLTREQMIKPVQVLEALESSLKSGKIEKVKR